MFGTPLRPHSLYFSVGPPTRRDGVFGVRVHRPSTSPSEDVKTESPGPDEYSERRSSVVHDSK